MRRETRWIVLAAAAAGLAAPGCGGSSIPKEYSSEAGNFRVVVPGRPKVTEQTIPSPVGPLTMRTHTSITRDLTSYTVAETVYPENLFQSRTPDEMLDDSVQGMTTSGEATIKSKRPINFNGHPGREVRFEVHSPGVSEPGVGRSRLLLIGHRLYQVFVIGPKSKVKPDATREFLQSFALLKPVVAVAVASRPTLEDQAEAAMASFLPSAGDAERPGPSPESDPHGGSNAKEYTFEQGNFRIRIPGRLKVKEETLQSPAGPIAVRMHSSTALDHTDYTAGEIAYPETLLETKAPEDILDDGLRGIAKSGHWDVKSERPVRFHGHPGREIQFEVIAEGEPEVGIGRYRVLMVRNRMYMVGMIEPKSKVVPGAAETFIDSFALLRPVAVAVDHGATAPKEYRSEEENFRVLVLGRPKVTEQTVPSESGPLMVRMHISNVPNHISYVVAVSVFSEAVLQSQTPDELLENSVQGIATSERSTVKSKRPIRFNGHPGREIEFEVQSPGEPEVEIGRSRLVLIGNRLYQVFGIGRKSSYNPRATEEFINSFALLRPVAQTASRPKPSDRAEAKPEPEPDARPEPSGAKAGGAEIVSFQWADDDDDRVGGHHQPENPDGTKDQHFKLRLTLPPDSTIETLTITSGGFHKWVTKPTPGLWPVAIFRNGEAVNRAHVERVGTFSGAQDLDLYINTGLGLGPGSPYGLSIVVRIEGREHTLTSECKRP